MKSVELDYELPPDLIAQQPAARRDASRLLGYERGSGSIRHRQFADLREEIGEGTIVVVNDTRVVPARIPIERPKGEVLLLEPLGDGLWEGLARPTRRLRPGRRYGPVELVEHLGEGVRIDGQDLGGAAQVVKRLFHVPARQGADPAQVLGEYQFGGQCGEGIGVQRVQILARSELGADVGIDRRRAHP